MIEGGEWEGGDGKDEQGRGREGTESKEVTIDLVGSFRIRWQRPHARKQASNGMELN
jgi:hypothetical protein